MPRKLTFFVLTRCVCYILQSVNEWCVICILILHQQIQCFTKTMDFAHLSFPRKSLLSIVHYTRIFYNIGSQLRRFRGVINP